METLSYLLPDFSTQVSPIFFQISPQDVELFTWRRWSYSRRGDVALDAGACGRLACSRRLWSNVAENFPLAGFSRFQLFSDFIGKEISYNLMGQHLLTFSNLWDQDKPNSISNFYFLFSPINY